MIQDQVEVCTFGQFTKTRRNLARTCVTLWLQGGGSPCQVLGQPRVTSTVSSNAPSDLGTSGRQRGFLFLNFSGAFTELKRFPGTEKAVSWRPWGADVRPCVFGLFVYGGGDGAQRVRTHNPTSFPPKFAARSGSLQWKAMASRAGETVGLLSGSCSPQAALGGSTPP